MKSILLKTIVIGVTLSAPLARASLDLGPTPGSSIEFTGSSKTFTITANSTPSSAYYGDQWEITSGGPASGLLGWFNGGPWSYGPITVSGNHQSANVTTPAGSFVINDGSGFLAIGTVNWVQVITDAYAGGVNAGPRSTSPG